MRKIYISEAQKEHLKKAIAAQDQVGGMVGSGSMGMVTGMVVEEEGNDAGQVITLYHGVMAPKLEHNVKIGGFEPRVCSEGGPKAIWMSEKQYGYQFVFKFDIPVEQVSQMTNVDYIYEDFIPFGQFNCELVKTNISVHYSGFIVHVDLLDQNLLANQCRIISDLPEEIRKMFEPFPGVYEQFVKPYLKQRENLSEGIKFGVQKWYRGYNSKFGLYGADTPSVLWLTMDLDYAMDYARNCGEDGAVMEFDIDQDKCCGSIYDLPEDLDYYDGPDEETAKELLGQGINSYCFWANQDSSYCMCLWSKEPIVSTKQIPLNESMDVEKYQIGFEPGGFEPNGHIINETNDRFNGESFSKNAGTITFITFQENPMVVHYSNEQGMTHNRLTQRLMKTGAISTYDFNDKTTIRADVQQTGRYWVGQNTISFWTTPALPKDRLKLRNVVEQLGLDKNNLDIDFWDTKKVLNINSPFVIPYKWFFNGTFDDMIGMGAYSITKRSDNAYFVMYGDFKQVLLDRDGNVVNTLNEDREWCEKFDYKPYFKSIAEFLQDNGIDVSPFPKVVIHHAPQEGLYIRTGFYDPDTSEVHVFVADRHPKDVLRSFTHEMIHHHQNITGTLGGYKGQTIKGDDVLEKLESEAYLKGNIYFRRWTEELRPQVPGTMGKTNLNESITDVYNLAEDNDYESVRTLLSEFFSDKRNGVTKKRWRTIPARQYQSLLQRYMQDPITARIPENVVYDWFENIVVANAFAIEHITELAGHSQYFPYDEVADEFDAWMPGKYSTENEDGEMESSIVDYESGYEALEAEGFYDWCSLPDGSDGWSDYGIGPIFKELSYFKPGMPAGDLLVLINRVLHISHCRGDLASAFIEGGSESCSSISGIMRESRFDVAELTNPEDVDLSSFNVNDDLNPMFWKDGKLDSRIRIALLDIADDFYDTLDVSWVEPSDVIMTGSLANYNWSTKYSDIDLHIIVDFSKVDENVKLVKDYFDSKRKNWNDTHEKLTMFGFPVELYVQDEHEPHASSGVYSLENNEWLIEPSIDNFDEKYDEDLVRDSVSEYMNEIDDLEDEYDASIADCDLSELHEKVIDLFKRIKDERKNGFERGGGEYNTGNIIFKALRRNGYIEKLDKLRTDTYDTMKSVLNEGVVSDKEYHYIMLGYLNDVIRNNRISMSTAEENDVKDGMKYLSLTRSRSNQHGFPYGVYTKNEYASKDNYARIEFDGAALNNVRNVNIKPFDYTYHASFEDTGFDNDDEDRMNGKMYHRQQYDDWMYNGDDWYDEDEDQEDTNNPHGINRQFFSQSEDRLYAPLDYINNAIKYINRIDVMVRNENSNDYVQLQNLLNTPQCAAWRDKVFIYHGDNNAFNYQK